MDKEALKKLWIGDLDVLVHETCTFGDVVVVTRETETETRYYVLRFFPIHRDGWQVSCDYDGIEMNEALGAMAQAFKLVM
jgi:hypothetical protein